MKILRKHLHYFYDVHKVMARARSCAAKFYAALYGQI